MAATLTGPVLLPNGDPMAGAAVKVRLVAGDARTPGHINGTARAGVASDTIDEDGNFSIEVPTLGPEDPLVYPPQSYYLVVIGGGRWPKYEWKVKPTTSTSYVFTDPSIGGETEDLLPPDFVQIEPTITTDDIAGIVAQYFEDNPIDVSAAVDEALTADPPLFVDNDLSELADPVKAANARANLGVSADSDVDAQFVLLNNRVGTQELLEATDPAVRSTDLDGAGLVLAPNHDAVEFDIVSGVVRFVVEGGVGSTEEVQPHNSDLDAIAALNTTAFGRAFLELANVTALYTVLAPSGLPGTGTFLRGDGVWAAPPSGEDGGAVDSVNGEVGDVVLTASDVGADPAGSAAAAQLASQPVDTDLTAIAALSTTTFGRAFLTMADAAATRTALGLGTAATTNATAYDPAGSAAAAQAASQPVDTDLTAIAALTTQTYGRGVLGLTDSASLRTYAGVGIGTAVQAFDTDLSAIAALTSAADKVPYATGAGTWALADMGSFARGLLALTTSTSVRSYLGLVLGTDVQPFDSDLTAIAALSTAAFGRSLLTTASAGAARTLLSASATLIAGDNITLTDNGDGTITVSSTGGTLEDVSAILTESDDILVLESA